MGKFNLATFFGEEPPDRITTDATLSVSVIKNRLVSLFGNDVQLTEEMAQKMKEKMLEDLHYGRKEECISAVGISVLFSRSGGKLTPAMNATILSSDIKDPTI